MTVFFVGAEKDCWDLTGSPNVPVEDATFFDAAYSRCSMQTGTSAAHYLKTLPWSSALNELWLHFYIGFSGSISSNDLLQVLAGNTVLFYLEYRANASDFRASYQTGGGNAAATGNFTITSGKTYDIRIKGGSGGLCEIYEDGALLASGSFSGSAVVGLTNVRFFNCNNSRANGVHVSQVIVADVSTIGWKVVIAPATSNGNYTAFSGDFNDIDEAITNDSDFVSGAANGNKETFKSNAPSVTGFDVKAVAVAARLKRDATGPQNAKLMLRQGGTDYSSANVAALSTSFEARQNIWNTDPATSAAWTAAAAASANLEFGLEAVT